MAASIKCGHPVKTNGKFEVNCDSAKGKFSTSYSACDGTTSGGATTGSATTGSATTGNSTTGTTGSAMVSGALELAAFSMPTCVLVALAAIDV